MKKHEIVVGGLYRAWVAGEIVTVRVDRILKRDHNQYVRAGTTYRCTVVGTGLSVDFRSAAKFRGPAQMGV